MTFPKNAPSRLVSSVVETDIGTVYCVPCLSLCQDFDSTFIGLRVDILHTSTIFAVNHGARPSQTSLLTPACPCADERDESKLDAYMLGTKNGWGGSSNVGRILHHGSALQGVSVSEIRLKNLLFK